jgi:hypothetical protein
MNHPLPNPLIYKRKGDPMIHDADIAAARERIEAGQRTVEARKRAIAEIEAESGETWLARELLAQSEATLHAHRAHLAFMTGK